VLLTSAAIASIAISNAARAQDANPSPTGMINEAQGGNTGVPTGMINEPQSGTAPVGSINDPSIVITQPGTTVTDRDPVNVTGIGQMIIDQQNGFIGLCTGTLINPRTVIFAAHCVNENPDETAFQNPWGYGTGPGQLPIAFGFSNNNNAAGNSAFGQWLGNYKTNAANYLYNVNQVLYNPASTQLGLGNNFLQGDIAIASLDTPAANVPTWAILLSALPAPSAIDPATGTGYHVTIAGYGNNGVGANGGSGGIDYRRRIAENYVGLLGSLDDVDTFLFGAPDGLPQNLYQVDFDSPNHSNQYDFNVFRDDPLPNEGITASGDSGGPLILDRAYAKQVIIGVLSGGSRYYNNQPSAAYGTSSFYQPLYLFWDYIVANNPYRYVGAKAGDAKWSDPTHWVTNLDPAYQIITGGQLVNGLPTTLGDGVNGIAGKFGDICNEGPGYSDCYNVTTGVETYNGTQFFYDPVTGTAGTTPIPSATLANGLVGATNFVPNNIDPNAATQTNARYFDVTLSAAGTTTLDTTATVDRFTMTTSVAKLAVTSTGSLTSLIGINQLDGLVTNNGVMSTPGDYLMLSGGLTGAGRINSPFFTNVTGMIAPGTLGGVGTMTFGGNVILSSGSLLMMDLGPNLTSDKIAVVTTATGNGIANVGGNVGFAPVTGYTIRSGDIYTIVTAQGGVTGTFNNGTPLSAILTPKFVYSANAVQVQIVAGTYASVVSSSSPVQGAYARLLDQNRATNYSTLSSVYGILDLQNQATIRGTLDALAPRTETLKSSLGTVALDNMANFYANRMTQLANGDLGGTVAMIGQPIRVASLGSLGATGNPEVQDGSDQPVLVPGKLPDDMAAYFAGGYLTGDSAPMPTAIPLGGRDNFDGYYLAAGIEKMMSDNVIGFSLSYTDTKGNTVNGQRAKGKLYQGTIYGRSDLGNGVALDSQFSAGLFDTNTTRAATLPGASYTLRSQDGALAVSSEVGLSKAFYAGSFSIAPRAAFRGSTIDFSTTAETGGPVALKLVRERQYSAQGRAGLVLGGGNTIKPFLSAYYVHEFHDTPGAFGANFVGGVGPNALFALAGRDKDWGEVSGGLSVDTGQVTLSASAETTIGRDDVTYQSYRGSIKFHF
jgi:hypothetical protein